GTPIDMQACGSDGRTALSYAAWAGRAETLDFLISRCGLDVNATNDKGESALYFACMNGHKSAVTVLLNAGANKEKLCQHDICQNLYNFRAEEYESINRTKEEIWAELSKR
ncbi:HACE1, partial [Symbiodinium microadriaticum]